MPLILQLKWRLAQIKNNRCQHQALQAAGIPAMVCQVSCHIRRPRVRVTIQMWILILLLANPRWIILAISIPVLLRSIPAWIIFEMLMIPHRPMNCCFRIMKSRRRNPGFPGGENKPVNFLTRSESITVMVCLTGKCESL